MRVGLVKFEKGRKCFSEEKTRSKRKKKKRSHLWSLREGSFLCVLCGFSDMTKIFSRWPSGKYYLWVYHGAWSWPWAKIQFLAIDLWWSWKERKKKLWKLSLHQDIFAVWLPVDMRKMKVSWCRDFDMPVLLALKATGLIKKLETSIVEYEIFGR